MKKFNYALFDIFAIPVSLFATRRIQYYGSLAGMILSAIMVIIILVFMTYKLESVFG